MKINNYISRVLLLIGLYIAFLLLASVIGGVIYLVTKDMTALLLLGTVISFGGSVIVYHKVYDKKFVDVSLFQKPESWKWFIVAIILFVAAIPVVNFFSEPETDQTILKLCTDASVFKIIILVFGVSIFPAVFEEWFFRGIMQRNIAKVTKNNYIAIVITALIFSFMHFDMGNFIARFVLGFVLGLLFYYSKSLWVNIFVHLTNNFIVLVVLLLQSRGEISDPEEIVFDNVFYIIPSLLIIAFTIYLYEKKRLINSKS